MARPLTTIDTDQTELSYLFVVAPFGRSSLIGLFASSTEFASVNVWYIHDFPKQCKSKR